MMKRKLGSEPRAMRSRILVVPIPEEIQKVLAEAMKGPGANDVADVVTLLLHTGMRVGELRNLRWTDVNFDERYVAIHPRNANEPRQVPMAKRVIQTLSARRELQPESEFVLGSRPGLLIVRVVRQLMQLSRQVSHHPFHLYGLRRAFGLRWMNAGCNLESLCYVMGYSTKRLAFKNLIPAPSQFRLAAQELAKIEE